MGSAHQSRKIEYTVMNAASPINTVIALKKEVKENLDDGNNEKSPTVKENSINMIEGSNNALSTAKNAENCGNLVNGNTTDNCGNETGNKNVENQLISRQSRKIEYTVMNAASPINTVIV